MQPEPKKHVSHAIAWSLIALLAGSLAFGIWTYFSQISDIYDNSFTISFSHKKTATTKPTTTAETTTTDATADWKTYTNDTYDFSFKYPETWFTDNDTGNSITLFSNYKNSSQYDKSNYPSDILFIGSSEYSSAAQTSDQKYIIDQKTIGDITVYSLRNSEVAEDSKVVVRKIGKFTANGKTYQIFAGSGDEPLVRAEKEISYFDQIVPTLKIVK